MIADVEVDGLGDYFVGERVPVWIAVGERKVLLAPASAVQTRNGIDYDQGRGARRARWTFLSCLAPPWAAGRAIMLRSCQA